MIASTTAALKNHPKITPAELDALLNGEQTKDLEILSFGDYQPKSFAAP